jgi:hypothetical protein
VYGSIGGGVTDFKIVFRSVETLDDEEDDTELTNGA